MARIVWGRQWLPALAMLVAAAIAGRALAQTADAKPTVADVSASSAEIVVTATRTEQTLGKVPESVSAYTAAKMDVEGIKSFADLAKFSPGVSFDDASHDIAIRGISSTAGSGTTGIYIDDTPIQTRALGFNANNALPAVFDLARVEVLRGPQGTLFGAGSEGGAVRYITAQPSTTVASGYAHAEVAGTEGGALSYEGGAAVGGPIVPDVLGFRISAWARRDGGWIDRVDYQTLAVTDADANSVDTVVLRGALAWTPTSALTITPGINYQDRDQHNYDDYWVSISDPAHGRYRNGTPDRMADADRFWLPTLKIDYDVGPVRLISDTAYYDRTERVNGYSGTLYDLSYFQQLTGAGTDPQGSPCAQCATDPSPLLLATGPNLPGFGPYVAHNITTNTQQNIVQEVRLQSNEPAAPLIWVVGLFLSADTQRSTEEINDPQLPALTQYLWGEDMLTAWGESLLANGDDYINDTIGHDRQIALYVDATWSITDRLKLTAGARYAWTHYDFTNRTDGPQALLDDGGVAQLTSGSKNEAPFTPKLGISYQITDHDLVYATASEGYRIGGATPPLPSMACGGDFPTSYNSDTVNSLEIGSKGSLFDHALQIATSAYYIQWKNIQQAVYVPACGLQYTTNLGTAVSQGLDLQSQWRVTQALTLELAVGYNDAAYSRDAVSKSGDVLALKGDSLGAIPWTLAAGAQYDFQLLGRDAFMRVDDEYASRRTAPIPAEDPGTVGFDPGLTPDPATNQLSMRAGVTLAAWKAEVYVDNLLNSHPQLGLTHQDQFTLLYEAQSFRPLTVGLSVSGRY
jgi:outer membrane receptor protein involved in Fe transport